MSRASLARSEEVVPQHRILQPRQNCWRIDRADRFASIQDAADYFRLVRQALLDARKSVFILGWDITAQTDLLPDPDRDHSPAAPTRLDHLLRYVARRRPGLRCYILIWDYGALYTLERDPFSRWRLGWRMPRNVRFGFDDHHALGGSHHQKIVVVDDQLAFCGGIDLTGHRWDTSAHRLEEPARVTPVGKAYGPYHEVQAMVSGAAAASFGQLARDRWRALGTARLPPVAKSTHDLWPANLEPDLEHVDVAISRTMPELNDTRAVRECERLFLDSIALAQHTIYIESQYFSSTTIAGALSGRLREPRGPEVVIVSPQECQGWLERNTMGTLRDRVFRQLLGADAHGRLRLVYPLASRNHDVPTFVHSKVMIVDDTLVRIGSANCAARSLGVDTECDVAAEAGTNAHREGVRRIRDRLLAEHLGLAAGDVSRELARTGSLCAMIDDRRNQERTLARIELPPEAETVELPDMVKAAADPAEPVAFGSPAEGLVPAVEAAVGHRPVWVLPAFGVLITLIWALTFRWLQRPQLQTIHETLMDVPATPAAFWIAVVIFVLGSLVLIPIEILAIVSGVMFGAAVGGMIGIAGSLVAAAAGYLAGRTIGARGLRKWMSRRSYQSGHQLGMRGLGSVIVLHLSGVASAGAVNLLCGAGRVSFGRFLAGTAISIAPMVAILSGWGALLRNTLLEPSGTNAIISLGTALLLLLLATGLRTLLLIRQFGPSMSRHRDRAEFG